MRGASGESQIHAAHKAKAATPRIRRSVILRPIDRGAGSKIRKTRGSTDIIASERVTLGNSGITDGAATSIGDAAGLALTDSLVCGESSIERRLRTGPVSICAIVDSSEPGRRYVSKKRAEAKRPLRVRLGRGHGDSRQVDP